MNPEAVYAAKYLNIPAIGLWTFAGPGRSLAESERTVGGCHCLSATPGDTREADHAQRRELRFCPSRRQNTPRGFSGTSDREERVAADMLRYGRDRGHVSDADRPGAHRSLKSGGGL